MKDQIIAIAFAFIMTVLLFLLRHLILTVGKRDENQRRAHGLSLKKAGNPKLKAVEGVTDSPKALLRLTRQSTHTRDSQPGGAGASERRSR